MTNILGLGGVDTQRWQQHSVRAASAAHHRKHRGITNHQLAKLADWSSVYGTLRNFMTDTISYVFEILSSYLFHSRYENIFSFLYVFFIASAGSMKVNFS